MSELSDNEVSNSEVSGDSNTDSKDVGEVEETELDDSGKTPSDELETELDNKYDSYIGEKNLSSFKKNDGTSLDKSESSTDKLDSKIDNNSVKHGEEQVDDVESKPEQIKCRNENLEGQEHPETGVPFERRQVDIDGKRYEVVVPKFESAYDAQLPENMYEATDREQFKECNMQLQKEIVTNKDLREQFDDEQLEQIENGDTPDGYTWHHDAEAGKMQLVDTETHQKTGHTGGRSIWGGGTESR